MTVDRTTEIEIRRLCFAEHWKKGTIVTQLGVHHDVVERVVGPLGPEPKNGEPRTRVLDPYRDFVKETLGRYPSLVATRIYDMLGERGYTGSLRTLRRFVLPHRPAIRGEVYVRIETLAGEQSQIDWAHVGRIRVKGGVRRDANGHAGHVPHRRRRARQRRALVRSAARARDARDPGGGRDHARGSVHDHALARARVSAWTLRP